MSLTNLTAAIRLHRAQNRFIIILTDPIFATALISNACSRVLGVETTQDGPVRNSYGRWYGPHIWGWP